MTDDDVPFRGSRRSRSAAAVSALTLRQISAVLPPERAWGLWASRLLLAQVMNTFGPSLAQTHVKAVDSVLPDGRRVVGEWVYGSGAPPTDRDQPAATTTGAVSPRTQACSSPAAIFYVHGSGYAMCSARTHRRLTSWLSKLTGLPVFCVDYRLAPRYRFPTAAEDVRAAWDWLTSGCSPERIVIAGDSAGGHLSVDLLLQPDVAAAHPAALVLLSPLIDLTFTLATATERQRRDPAIRAAHAVRLLGLYTGGTDPADPRLALDVRGGPPLPRTLIQAGGAEMLAGDARRLAEDIRAAGGSCELQVWPDQVHVFQAMPRLLPEAAMAMAHVARFIRELPVHNMDTGKAG